MKWTVLWPIGALCLFSALPTYGQAFSDVPPPQTSVVRFSPDLAEIVELVGKKASEAEVLQTIRMCPRPYSVSEAEVSALKKAGVSDRAVTAIREHDAKIFQQAQKQPSEPAGYTPAQPSAPLVSPKMAGGNPAAPETVMRGEQPLIRITAPLALTNAPAVTKKTRPWTSSIVVEHTPPPPKLELKTAPPNPNCVWVSGHWIWEDRGWTWQSGYWIQKPSATAKWMNGYWNSHGRGWIWIPGRWL